MLDHFLVCGGLDALLARITPSSGLECSAQKLGELLRAFEIVCDRAAPTTAPHFALSYARHLQRAAHARLRREASSVTNTTKQDLDGRWDADEKIRRTCDRLARCLLPIGARRVRRADAADASLLDAARRFLLGLGAFHRCPLQSFKTIGRKVRLGPCFDRVRR